MELSNQLRTGQENLRDWYRSTIDLIPELDAAINLLGSAADALDKVEANAAAMHAALTSCTPLVFTAPHKGCKESHCDCRLGEFQNEVKNALASDAGEAFLKRLKEAEIERDSFQIQLWCGEDMENKCTNHPEVGECSNHTQWHNRKKISAITDELERHVKSLKYHQCGTPDACCDGTCVDLAHTLMELEETSKEIEALLAVAKAALSCGCSVCRNGFD